jgi:N6-adenosine-specific RNA methylase IME4
MKKYDIIYADPPWAYNSRANIKTRFRGGARSHYPVMNIKDITAMPINKLSNDSSLLFLWVTMPLLPEGLAVMSAWGFKYKTCAFTWVKTNKKSGTPFFGVGYYTKSNAELCLLGTRGKVIKPQVNTVSQIIIAPRREHSRKPAEARDKIVQMYPEQTKIELFARESTDGWFCWGNEIDKFIEQ